MIGTIPKKPVPGRITYVVVAKMIPKPIRQGKRILNAICSER